MANHWYSKHRPLTLDDYVWPQAETKARMEAWVANPLDHPHLILTGPTGTGKTSLTKIIRDMLDLGYEYKFIPASTRNKLDTINDEIISFCEAGGFADMKLIVLDECENITPKAQDALRNVLDMYEGDVRFIFTCNNPTKVLDAIHSRCWLIEIDQLEPDVFLSRLAEIAIAEGVDLDDETNATHLLEITDSYHPNMRKAISVLQYRTTDGKIGPKSAAVINQDLIDRLQTMIKSGAYMQMREFVASVRPDEFENVYRHLYWGSETLFGDAEGACVQIIANHLYRGSQAGLPDVTMCACLITLSEEVNG